MPRIFIPSIDEEKAWADWIAKLPESIRAIGSRLDPWTLYRMRDTRQYVTLSSIFDDGTISVSIRGEFNIGLLFDREVFGVDPSALKDCDEVPIGNGSLFDIEEIEENIDIIRVAVRPDLFVLNADGKAIRKS